MRWRRGSSSRAGARSACAISRTAATHEVRARAEIVLAGGPINSPQLLKLSGIGPAEELRALGIPVVRDLPGVGENLQDHLEFYFQVACTQPITLYGWSGLAGKAAVGARWLFSRDGLGATNHFESCGFIRSRPGIRYPDIQYHFLPLAVSYDGKGLATEHGFQAHVGPMRSKSRGYVRLASRDPREHPRIRFNYMSHADDWIEMRACVRLTREIFAQAAFDRLSRARDPARRRRRHGRGHRRLHPRQGRERLPSLLHLQDGRSRRSDGGGRSGNARHRR